MLKKIHVNKHHITQNLKNGTDKPVVTVKTYKSNDYGHSVEIDGPSEVVYPEKPLSCGARVYIKTSSKVRLFNRKGKLIREIK